jgi:hypothetical protein
MHRRVLGQDTSRMFLRRCRMVANGRPESVARSGNWASYAIITLSQVEGAVDGLPRLVVESVFVPLLSSFSMTKY